MMMQKKACGSIIVIAVHAGMHQTAQSDARPFGTNRAALLGFDRNTIFSFINTTIW
jgi:hypothetical protein